jgi:hypothetical protein
MMLEIKFTVDIHAIVLDTVGTNHIVNIDNSYVTFPDKINIPGFLILSFVKLAEHQSRTQSICKNG